MGTAWKLCTLCCAAVAVLGGSQTTADQGIAVVQPATSAATISVLDAFRVMINFTGWGVDLAMETAGYGETWESLAAIE